MIQEKETKFLISQDEYDRICKSLSAKYQQLSYKQRNIYYDTPTFALYMRGETLRIRENGGLKLEYKSKKKWQDGWRVCEERCVTVEDIPLVLDRSKTLLVGLYDYPLNNLGELVTERIDFHIQNVLVSLDHNYYGPREDFEIEIEVLEDNGIDISHLEHYFTSSTANKNGKYSRFLKAQYGI